MFFFLEDREPLPCDWGHFKIIPLLIKKKTSLVDKRCTLLSFNCCFSLVIHHVRPFCNPIVCSLSGSSVHGILRQEYWSELPFPSSGDLPNPRLKLAFPASVGRFFTTEPPGKLHPFTGLCHLSPFCSLKTMA